MRERKPKIFAAFYDADPTIGGLIAALKHAGIEALVIPAHQWPSGWIPEWVPEPERVAYYVLSACCHEARFIAYAKCFADEWIAAKKIALAPRPRWWLVRGAD